MSAPHDEAPVPGTTVLQETQEIEQANFKTEATVTANLALLGHAVHKGQSGDFVVCKYGVTRYCQDLAALKAFVGQLGVKT